MPTDAVTTRAVNLLIVDDDRVDAQLIERAFRNRPFVNHIVCASDGDEGLAVLNRLCKRLHAPFVVLLDMNLPRVPGVSFLKTLRDDPALCGTIVFVLSTSDADRDKALAHEHDIAGYIVKSEAGDLFRDVVPIVQSYLGLAEAH